MIKPCLFTAGLCLLVGSALFVANGQDNKPDPLQPLLFLEGIWHGQGKGRCRPYDFPTGRKDASATRVGAVSGVEEVTSPKREDAGGQTVLERKTRQKLQRPRLWKVLLHNDDYTTMEFVVLILMSIFHHNENDAMAIMLHVHRHGIGVAGVYTREIAETKVAEVTKAAEEAEFPLLCTMEPDDSPQEGDESP